MNNILDVIREFLKTTESRFISIVYTNKENETSKYVLQTNVNIRKVYERDFVILSKYVSQNELEEQVKTELLKSIRESLDTNFNNSKFTKKNYYENLSHNIDYHENKLYLRKVFQMSRVVLDDSKSTRKHVNSSEKTLTKKRIEKMLRRSKIREFCLDMTQIHNVSINKNTLVLS